MSQVQEKPAPTDFLRRLSLLNDLIDAADLVFRDGKTRQAWFMTPLKELQGRSPAELIETTTVENFEVVLELLRKMPKSNP